MWIEALDEARVEASSILRKAENIYYPPAIRASVPSSSRIDTNSEVVEVGKANTDNAPTPSDNPSVEAEQPGVTKKEENANQGVAPDAMKPSAAI